MSKQIEPPLFTLRGHKFGVTAIASSVICGHSCLISGDEEGHLVIWDLQTYRKIFGHNVVSDRIQSLKIVQLQVDKETHHVAIIQSRDSGIIVMDLHKFLEGSSTILKSFVTHESLFSRGDAINISIDKAILAYPSCLENHLVTVRVLGDDAETLLSGTAQRISIGQQKHCSVFDIKIENNPAGGYLIFAGYEDGCLCLFRFDSDNTKTVPVLNSEGLKIDLLKKYDLNVKDFISAFDTFVGDNGVITAICGSPAKSIIILTDLLGSKQEPDLKLVALKHQGTSSISIRPDNKLFTCAGWDGTVRVYSMKSFKHLANLKHHSKQVPNILFVKMPLLQQTDDPKLCPKNVHSNHLLCCASMEGTISISSIY